MTFELINTEKFIKGARAAVLNLEANKELLNSLNVFPIPDGDTGTNMNLTMQSSLIELDKNKSDSCADLAKSISRGSLMGARGNSGVILSQILRGFSDGFANAKYLGINELNLGFNKSSEVAYRAVMKPTEGTILTVIRMMAEFSQENFRKYDNIMDYLAAVIAHGNEALKQTQEMLPALREAGVVDAGGKGLMVLMEGFIKGLLSESVDYVPSPESFDLIADGFDHDPNQINFTYCTEFMILGAKENDIDTLREHYNTLGDCVLVVGDDEVIKVHLHTNNPGQAMEYGLSFGQLSDMKIDNMRLQNEDFNEKTSGKSEDIKTIEKESDYGFVVVSYGSGIGEIFKSLNVDEIIEGGQTMNPSTEDIAKACDRINAKNIFVFPNNKNIILSAKQAEQLTDKNIYIIETRSIPEAFAALLYFDEAESVKENIKEMNEVISEVQTLQITYAVRDSKFDNLEVKKGDYLGMLQGDLVGVSGDITELFLEILEKTNLENSSLITIYYGEDVTKSQAEILHALVEKKYDEFDVELVYGGQPVYYYLISVE